MSLIGDTAAEAGKDAANRADAEETIYSSFRFVPRELAGKCRTLIESFHAINGYAGLPDMLWLSEARGIIEGREDLAQIFKKASRSRGAKRANDSFVAIATIVVALEALARDFAGWGKRFPTAKREAEKLVGDAPEPRIWLMDLYLYPSSGARRELTNTLTPPATDAELSAQN